MSLSRAIAPFKRANLFRPRRNNPWDIFERDPFFAGIAPFLNNELTQFQRFNFPRVDIKESPKAYRLEAEVPGFRKEDINIEFLDPRTLRISGKRHLARESAEGATQAEGSEAGSETVEAKQTSTEGSAGANSSTSAGEQEFKEVAPVEAEEGYEVMETERERDVSFTRQWKLPEGVDQDAVKASLDHGILSVTLPKLKQEAARKVVIE